MKYKECDRNHKVNRKVPVFIFSAESKTKVQNIYHLKTKTSPRLSGCCNLLIATVTLHGSSYRPKKAGFFIKLLRSKSSREGEYAVTMRDKLTSLARNCMKYTALEKISYQKKIQKFTYLAQRADLFGRSEQAVIN
ncbi:hypothetical protein LOAG_04790 [Loa loa]|uniref:Uncharacterized protein n=1 Tax=Loa loa TaxID=7209 RepID=A0A1S0U1N1_LOALO|nr:hypothetical protein LOAG_04790 [Loa loa]EFO23695.1 hypothetical protein LOAG_04790 [Loa loa]